MENHQGDANSGWVPDGLGIDWSVLDAEMGEERQALEDFGMGGGSEHERDILNHPFEFWTAEADFSQDTGSSSRYGPLDHMDLQISPSTHYPWANQDHHSLLHDDASPVKAIDTATNTSTITKSSPSRLPCNYEGCKKTFPRNYELERHKNAVHLMDTTFYYFVYGCYRNTDPFPRIDEFREYFRARHKNIDKHACVFEQCHHGPLTLLEFKDHLTNEHSYVTEVEVTVNAVLKTLGMRRIRIGENRIRLVGSNECPLAFLGCEFQGPEIGESHLRTHTVADILRASEAILSCGLFDVSLKVAEVEGIGHYPMCAKTWQTNARGVLRHIMEHERELRKPYLLELYETFRPCLWGVDLFHSFCYNSSIPVLMMELRAERILRIPVINSTENPTVEQ